MKPCRALVVLASLLALPAVAQDGPFRTPRDRPVDVERIELDLRVELEKRTVHGTALLSFKALRDLRAVQLDAVEQVIRGVRSGDTPLPFDYDGERLTVDLELKRGEASELRVDYTIQDPSAGLHFFGPSEGEPDVPLQVWSQGEPTKSRHWFPCVDHPDERQSTALTVRVPEGLQVISNGVLHSKKVEDGRAVWRYEQERAHVAYLVTLVVGRFDVVRDTWRGKPLAYYVPPGRKDDIERSFARTKDMLDLYSKLFGVDYPWPKYDQVVVEQFSFGGMENTGATTLNESTLHDARAHLDFSSEGLVAHELVHQWYGDLLTCRDWSHIWLNESFATYFANVWFEHSQGKDEFEHRVLGAAEGGMRGGKKRAIVDRRYPTPWSMFDGRAYPKGSCVLHMLRKLLGDDVFYGAIRAYTAAHQDGTVETHDLRRALERASGRNLERFFRDWTGRPGNVVLDVKLSRDAERGLISVDVKQKQKGEAYAFPAELLFEFGEERVLRTLHITRKTERFVLADRRVPTGFRFDPEEKVILKEQTVHKGPALWERQLRHDPSVIGRIRAVRALAKQRRPEAEALVRTALAEDAFWGVRAEAAKALGDAPGDAARDALIARLKAEPHPKARRACADALGKRGQDAAAAAALRAVLQDGDPSYFVESSATAAYARAVDPQDADVRGVLRKQLGKDSHREEIRQAAIRGLRSLDDSSLIPELVEWTQPRKPRRVRRAAAHALAVAVLPGTADEHLATAVDALEGMLRRGGERDQRAALEGLRGLGAKAAPARRTVEAAALNPSERVRDLAAKILEAIDAGPGPDVELKHLRKQARELKEKVKALEEQRTKTEARLERLERALGEGATKQQ